MPELVPLNIVLKSGQVFTIFVEQQNGSHALMQFSAAHRNDNFSTPLILDEAEAMDHEGKRVPFQGVFALTEISSLHLLA